MIGKGAGSATPLSCERTELLAAWVALRHAATHAPDYRVSGYGAHYPRSRSEYLSYAFDGLTLIQSKSRQQQSAHRLDKALARALSAPDVDTALAQGLVESFTREVSAAAVAPLATSNAVRAALAADLLLPLRALNQSRSLLSRCFPDQDARIAQALETITAQVLAGSFRTWRYDNETGREQLRRLTSGQRDIWQRASTTTIGALTLCEEDDLGLFWITKIGGPSHGFDYGPHCLLPLIANARSQAILVDDARYALGHAARAYLRLLESPAHTPVLYLEALQRDFPHRDALPAPAIDHEIYAAMVAHAVAKAKAMGVPLSLLPALGDPLLGGVDVGSILRAQGLSFKRRHERYWISASAGVFEASDTLTELHDWVHLEGALTEPLARLIV